MLTRFVSFILYDAITILELFFITDKQRERRKKTQTLLPRETKWETGFRVIHVFKHNLGEGVIRVAFLQLSPKYLKTVPSGSFLCNPIRKIFRTF